MKKAKGRKPWLLCLFAGAVVASATAIGTTYAMLHQQTEEVTNSFKTGIVNITIQEEFVENSTLPKDGTSVSKKVKIKNTDDGKEVLQNRIVPVYIRAALVPQWKNANGDLIAVDKDSIQFHLSSGENGWVEGADGYYYYTNTVNPEEETAELLSSVSVKKEYAGQIPEGAKLEVEVIADAVQAEGDARSAAWGKVTTPSGATISFQ